MQSDRDIKFTRDERLRADDEVLWLNRQEAPNYGSTDKNLLKRSFWNLRSADTQKNCSVAV